MIAKTIWTEAMISLLRESRKAGAGLDEVAAELKLSRTSVRDACVKYGIVKGVPADFIKPVMSDCETAFYSARALPAGHPTSWRAICAGTCLEGVEYERNASLLK